MRLILSTLVVVMLGNFVVAQCLVADYPFNGNANDETGNGYNATVNGATLTTDRFGLPNAAYEFDGIDDYIDTETTFDFEERSVSMWAMVYDASVPRRVLDHDANTLTYGAFSAVFKNGNLMTNCGGEGGNVAVSSPLMNTWYHIVLIRNATETKAYVNGNLVYTGTPTSSGSSINANPELVIGCLRSKADNFFYGKIDDILVYNCELSQSQIDSLFNVQASCLVAEYDFSGDANDETGNGYNGTVYGATLTSDRYGNANSAYEFDGIDDYIDTETSFDFEERSVSMWAMVYDAAIPRRVLDQDANSLDYGAYSAVFKNGELLTNCGGEGGNTAVSAPLMNTWYHIVLVRNSTETKSYVNGTLVYTGTPTSSGSSIDPNPELVIGCLRSKADNFFYGKIDDILVYNCELSESEIDSLYGIAANVEELVETDVLLDVFPNPMSNSAKVVIDIDDTMNGLKLEIVDLQGRVVKYYTDLANEVVINKGNLTSGTYLVRLIKDQSVLGSSKLIIE